MTLLISTLDCASLMMIIIIRSLLHNTVSVIASQILYKIFSWAMWLLICGLLCIIFAVAGVVILVLMRSFLALLLLTIVIISLSIPVLVIWIILATTYVCSRWCRLDVTMHLCKKIVHRIELIPLLVPISISLTLLTDLLTLCALVFRNYARVLNRITTW